MGPSARTLREAMARGAAVLVAAHNADLSDLRRALLLADGRVSPVAPAQVLVRVVLADAAGERSVDLPGSAVDAYLLDALRAAASVRSVGPVR